MTMVMQIVEASWGLFVEAAPYLVFGLAVAGLMYLFLSPATIVKHLRKGRVVSVFKAALLGIPLPLCSCGVLPAAAGMRNQGANRGATAAFLISTPESGVDSIAITYALLDPLMTVIRPVAAFCTAFAAGITENLLFWERRQTETPLQPDFSCKVDGCCDGLNCPPEEHRRHHSLVRKLGSALQYSFLDLYRELSGWIVAGFIAAGAITIWMPQDFTSHYLGGGLTTMFIMLAAGIPTYICATASTPVAAALILKGASPGAALVFLLAGPATNLASITVLTRVLGKRGVLVYLGAIGILSVLLGLLTDWLYGFLGVSIQVNLGAAAEVLPEPVHIGSAILLAALIIFFMLHKLVGKINSKVESSCPSCR